MLLAINRGAYLPLEEETTDQSSGNESMEASEKDELDEAMTGWRDKLKSKTSDGVREIWKRLKDVTGATIANVLGGRILERWNSIAPISGRFECLLLKSM